MMTSKAFKAWAWNNMRGLRALVLLSSILGVNYRSLKESSLGRLVTKILVVTEQGTSIQYMEEHAIHNLCTC